MAKRIKTLTVFGRDLDLLIKRAGKSTLREYADDCGISYKYLSQLRTIPERRPGRLYADLLKPFTHLRIIDLTESHQLSLRHRGRPLSLKECQELFAGVSDRELMDSIQKAAQIPVTGITPIPLVEKLSEEVTQNQPTGAQLPLYRRIFVGRQSELNGLRSVFDRVITGKGILVMISGEPGIGKTALCRQLASYVTANGGISMIGQCRESGALSPPYTAFVEVLRSYIVSRDVTSLTKELGMNASDVARIVPEINERMRVPIRSPANPSEEKYRLFQAITNFLGTITINQPILITLEDLHRSDRGTLELLEHVAYNISSKKILIVGTYRDTEVDQTHPLTDLLVELRRLPDFNRISLRGLSSDEVTRMLSGIIGCDTPIGLGEIVHHQTEGNPLFVEEVAHYLVEKGVISKDSNDYQLTKKSVIDLQIPVGLKEVIISRLSGLSKVCSQVLSVASVIGRDFRLDVLEKVARISEDEIFMALEEARKAALLEERAQIGMVRYRFTHVFFQQALYGEIIAPRRVRLHLLVAQALENIFSLNLDEYASELTEHFSHSSESSYLMKAVSYGEMAVKRAMHVYAFAEATRLLDHTINVQKILAPIDRGKLCDLILDLCDALYWVPDTRRIIEIEAPAAFSLAEDMFDGSRAVRACVAALSALVYEQAGVALTTSQWAEWSQRADNYAKPATAERAFADYALGSMECRKGDMKTGQRHLLQSYNLAKSLGHLQTLFLATFGLLQYRAAPQYASERVQIAEGVWNTSRTALRMQPAVLWLIGDSFLGGGQRKRAEEVWGELGIMADRTSNLHPQILSAVTKGVLATMDGRLQEAMDIAADIRTHGGEGGISGRNEYGSYADFRARIYLGEFHENLEYMPHGVLGKLMHCLLQAYTGGKEEVSQMLDRFVIKRPNMGTQDDETVAFMDVMYLEASVLIGHRLATELLLNRLSDEHQVMTGYFYITCVARHLGNAAAFLGRHVDARRYYLEAITACTETRFRSELALTHLQLAELLIKYYPHENKEAIDHLDFAINELREMNMQPSLKMALRDKQTLTS